MARARAPTRSWVSRFLDCRTPTLPRSRITRRGNEPPPNSQPPYQSQNANVRVSMLSRGHASAGVFGSSNAVCAVKRVVRASVSNT